MLDANVVRPCRLAAAVLLGTLVFVSGGASAAGPGAGSEAREQKDPNRILDPVNQIVMHKPEGWVALVPQADGVDGITVLINYPPLDETHAPAPAGGVKMELRVARLDGRSFTDWSRARQESMRQPGFVPDPAFTSEPRPYRIAGAEGVVYTRYGTGHIPSLQVELGWGRDRALTASIVPADSPALAEALAVLDGVRDAQLRAAAPTYAGRERGFQLAEPLQALIKALPAARPETSATLATCNGPAGTFDMGEAPNVPFTIQLPFPSGTSWEVGNIGSYFGNGCHINLNNDYYATDWNRRNTSCGAGYLEDDGQEVRPVAAGVVRQSDCNDTTGYGCQVLVEHTTGAGTFRTRYAHLQSTSLVPGILNTNVTTSNVIGRVGCSGLASCGPHLHLSLQQLVSGVYYSRCNGPASTTNCPNGLAKSSPQTPKPSPIQTAAGSSTLSDGGCYTAGTGGTPPWSVTIDDSSPSCGFFGPAQFWFSVTGYGINNQMRYTWNSVSTISNYAQWAFSVPTTATYKYEVFIPSNHATTTAARYYVWNGSAWQGPFVINQNNFFNAWVTVATLGVPAGSGQLLIVDATGEATGTKKVGVDAARVTRQ